MILSFAAFLVSLAIAQQPSTPSGSGTKADPYRIDSLPNLLWISATPTAWTSSFVQDKDIDASATSGWNAGAGFPTIGNYYYGFSGTYHGKGHKITRLAINRPDSTVVGLFGSLQYGAAIDSLGLEDCSITGGQSTGGFVGHTEGKTSMVRCWVTGTVKSKFTTVGNAYMNGAIAYVGGIAGDVFGGSKTDGSFLDCSASCDVSFRSTDTTLDAYVGGLVGNFRYGKVVRCTSSTRIEGGLAGGLVGSSTLSRLDQSIASGRIHIAVGKASSNGGGSTAGGLLGEGFWDTITSCRSSVDIAIEADSGTQNTAGGLVGGLTRSILTGSGASGKIEITSPSALKQLRIELGGLVGDNQSGSIQGCYASGNIRSLVPVDGAFDGGLVGYLYSGGAIQDCYATGSLTVSADDMRAGGLVGFNYGGDVRGSYATGAVAATSTWKTPMLYAGALIGDNGYGSATRVYWDADSSGLAAACGSNAGTCVATGLSRKETRMRSKFDSLDFAATWYLYENRTTPLLRSFLTPLVVTANDTSKSYDGRPFHGGNGVRYSQLVVDSLVKGSPVWSGTAQSAVDTGRYSIHADSLWSTQVGYLISYLDGNLRILPKALGVSGLVANGKVYDGTTLATLGGTASLEGKVASDDVALSGSALASFSDKNAGKAKNVVVGGLALSGTKAFDYVLAPIALQADIAPRSISIDGVAAQGKVYDGTTQAILVGGRFVDTVAGDALRLVPGVGSFLDPNVGQAKAVGASGFRIGGPDSSNYSLAAQPGGLTADITALPVSVFAQAVAKAVGATDPALPYTATRLLGTDTWKGSLARDAGEAAGEYPIRIGSLAAGPNYQVTYQGSVFTIRSPTSLAPPLAGRTRSSGLDVLPRRILASAALGSGFGALEMGDAEEGDLSVDIALSEAAWVEVSIFDHLGSPVISWSRDIGAADLRGWSPSADGRWILPVRWNLRTPDGRPVPTGVYLWKIEILGRSGAKLETVRRLGVR